VSGLTAKKEKYKLFSDYVTFLGYKVDKYDIYIPDEKIR